MPIWLIALLAYLALALPSVWLLVAALSLGTAADASASASPTVQGLPRSLGPTRGLVAGEPLDPLGARGREGNQPPRLSEERHCRSPG